MNELEKLESVYADARKAYEVARETYKVAKGTHVVSCEANNTADYEYEAAYDKAWHAANDAAMDINSYHTANREKKMKTENKMTELRAAAVASRDARMVAFTAYSAACVATDAAWDAYNAACEEARDAANTANAYEVGEYEANAYEAEDK